MTDHDRAEGKSKQAMGAVKEKFGSATGNEKLESEGAAQKTEGKAQDTFGRAKDKAKEIKDKIT